MIVIIEGTDLVGKSTLAERLAADRGWPIAAANERFPGIAGLLPERVPRLVIDATSAGATEVYEQVRSFLGERS